MLCPRPQSEVRGTAAPSPQADQPLPALPIHPLEKAGKGCLVWKGGQQGPAQARDPLLPK